MLTYRPFRNTDPPRLAALWRSYAGRPGWLQPMDIDLLEQHVFSKLYFDYAGLILAFDDDVFVGFAHAAFGPNAARDGIDCRHGVVCLLMAQAATSTPIAEMAVGLLAEAERYLRERGATTIVAGCADSFSPFYLGLYGGSRLPGILAADSVAHRVFTEQGYKANGETLILARDLARFEAPIDRRQMEVRRRMIVETSVDPQTRDWWEACTLGVFDVTRYELVPRVGGPAVGWALFRPLEQANTTSGCPAGMGLVEIFVQESVRRRGLAVFLLCEALRQFAKQGVNYVEAQTPADDPALPGLYRKLGFAEQTRATLFEKAG